MQRKYRDADVTVVPDSEGFVVTIHGADTQVKWVARGRSYPTLETAKRCLEAARPLWDDAPDLAMWRIQDPTEPTSGAVVFMGTRRWVQRALQRTAKKVHPGKPLELNENVVWTLTERRLDRIADTPAGDALRFTASHEGSPVFLQARRNDEPPLS